jgi:hypothetical protein
MYILCSNSAQRLSLQCQMCYKGVVYIFNPLHHGPWFGKHHCRHFVYVTDVMWNTSTLKYSRFVRDEGDSCFSCKPA